MILHLTPGSAPIEVHVHGEFGASEHITVTPRAEVPALAAPAAAAARRWPLVAALPVVAVLAGFVGHRIGSVPPVSGADRLAALRDIPRLPQPTHAPARDLTDPLPMPPRSDAAIATAAEVPPDLARLLAYPPVVTPPPAPVQPVAPSLAAPAGNNPFGLE